MEVKTSDDQVLGIEELLELGFKKVGNWCMQGEDIRFELTSCGNERDVLYAFVVNSKVKYIGKTIQTLNKRIYHYQNPGPSQKTNIRINGKIIKALKETTKVAIFVLVNQKPIFYRGIKIDLAAGIEDGVIDYINPDWNIRKGKRNGKQQFWNSEKSSADKIRQYVIDNYIQPTREKGIGNVSVRAGDIHKEMGLNNEMPLICSSLDAKKFITLANIQLIERSGPKQSSTSNWVFKIIS